MWKSDTSRLKSFLKPVKAGERERGSGRRKEGHGTEKVYRRVEIRNKS